MESVESCGLMDRTTKTKSLVVSQLTMQKRRHRVSLSLLLLIGLCLSILYRDSSLLLLGQPSLLQSTNLEQSFQRLNTSRWHRPNVTRLLDGRLHQLLQHGPHIDNVRILGERHSGTTYLGKYLQQCFQSLPIKDFLIRGKHWFQPTPADILRTASMTDDETLDSITKVNGGESIFKPWSHLSRDRQIETTFRSSIILILVRDPRQWLEGMRLGPWHWPNHLHLLPKDEASLSQKLYSGEGNRTNPSTGAMQIQKSFVRYESMDWKTFIKQPLYLTNETLSLGSTSSGMVVCQKGFPAGTISPCVQSHTYVPPSIQHIPKSFLRHLPFDTHNVIYELNSMALAPYAHPLALRAAKLRSWLALLNQWQFGGVAFLRYEDLLGGRADQNSMAMEALVQAIANLTMVSPNCRPLESRPKPHHELPVDMIEWIDQNADWRVEGQFGYYPTNDLVSRHIF